MNIPESVAQVIRLRASEHPDALAIVFGDRTLTYRELDERSSRVAQALLAAGAGPGARIAFVDRSAPECFEVLLGAAKIGAVLVPVNWRLTPREVAFIVEDSESVVVIAGREFADHVERFSTDAGVVHAVIIVGESESSETYEDWISAHPPNDPGLLPSPDDVVVQMYTSGTTGTPKGAMLTNRNMLCIVPYEIESLCITRSSVALVSSPLYHISGLGWGVTAFAAGCLAALIRAMDAEQLLRAITRYRVTHALFVPALLRSLLLIEDAEHADFSNLEFVMYGASPIPADVLKRAVKILGCKFVGAYGLTETAGEVTTLDPSEHDLSRLDLTRLLSVGRPLPWVELKIVDAESGLALHAGEVGEVRVRSQQVTAGYWKRPWETAEAIDPEGWLATGDAGCLDEDGYLYIKDRLKDVIISGGENIYPVEVENVLMSHPDITDVAVFGVPDDKWGETVMAVAVRRNGSQLEERELIDYARHHLAHYKCPTSVQWTEELPRTSSGKLLKRTLREPYWSSYERQVN